MLLVVDAVLGLSSLVNFLYLCFAIIAALKWIWRTILFAPLLTKNAMMR